MVDIGGASGVLGEAADEVLCFGGDEAAGGGLVDEVEVAEDLRGCGQERFALFCLRLLLLIRCSLIFLHLLRFVPEEGGG